ncbi:quercetin 2 [Hyphodiscus hymeniophilus]|uniref:Quercetin 2 n=1 Tax=Hyphodiscus hymeniophilus TaxID=353542 RepID=A0A9P6SPQ7_9HELO|nr:quercetin 2 [Hyphodiscus hymeniophilus]
MSTKLALPRAKIEPIVSSQRNHLDYGWLHTYQTFTLTSSSNVISSRGSLRVVNEDCVQPLTGFPAHRHRDFEIFSYVLKGELTHRDSMSGNKTISRPSSDDFFCIKRGDVQFTAAGSGIAHSEKNEHEKDWVHFMQIWVSPWALGLTPRYHTATFSDADKRKAFVTIISPLKAGPKATAEDEKAAVPSVPGTIPIHADFLMGAAIIPSGKTFSWKIGGDGAVEEPVNRILYLHLPMTKDGKSKLRLAGMDDKVLLEGDGAYVSAVNAGDTLYIESIGEDEAEVVLFDSNTR